MMNALSTSGYARFDLGRAEPPPEMGGIDHSLAARYFGAVFGAATGLSRIGCAGGLLDSPTPSAH